MVVPSSRVRVGLLLFCYHSDFSPLFSRLTIFSLFCQEGIRVRSEVVDVEPIVDSEHAMNTYKCERHRLKTDINSEGRLLEGHRKRAVKAQIALEEKDDECCSLENVLFLLDSTTVFLEKEISSVI